MDRPPLARSNLTPPSPRSCGSKCGPGKHLCPAIMVLRFNFWLLPRGASGISAPRNHHTENKEHHPRLIRRPRAGISSCQAFLVLRSTLSSASLVWSASRPANNSSGIARHVLRLHNRREVQQALLTHTGSYVVHRATRISTPPVLASCLNRSPTRRSATPTSPSGG